MVGRRHFLFVLTLTTALLLLPASQSFAQADETATDQQDQLREVPQEDGSEAQPAAEPADGEQAGGEAATRQVEKKPPGLFGGNYIFLVMIGGFILLYIWMGRSRRKRESKRKEMLANLQKGDKVTTIGGVIGTAIEVRPTDVTVKVDETNNVRMKFARWSIRGVGEEAKTEAPEEKN